MPSSGKSPLELLAQTCNSIGKEVKPKAIPQAAENKISQKEENSKNVENGAKLGKHTQNQGKIGGKTGGVLEIGVNSTKNSTKNSLKSDNQISSQNIKKAAVQTQNTFNPSNKIKISTKNSPQSSTVISTQKLLQNVAAAMAPKKVECMETESSTSPVTTIQAGRKLSPNMFSQHSKNSVFSNLGKTSNQLVTNTVQ